MKNQTGKIQILIFTLIIVGGLYFIFRPVPINRDNSIAFNTTVLKVTEGSRDNIILTLDDAPGIYFINKGLKKGINIDTLHKQIINKQVRVMYLKPSFVGGFSPVADMKYITELSLGDKVMYSEL